MEKFEVINAQLARLCDLHKYYAESGLTTPRLNVEERIKELQEYIMNDANGGQQPV